MTFFFEPRNGREPTEVIYYTYSRTLEKGPSDPTPFFVEIWDKRAYYVITYLVFKKKISYLEPLSCKEWCSNFFSLDDENRLDFCMSLGSNNNKFFSYNSYSFHGLLLNEEEMFDFKDRYPWNLN